MQLVVRQQPVEYRNHGLPGPLSRVRVHAPHGIGSRPLQSGPETGGQSLLLPLCVLELLIGAPSGPA